MDIQKEYDRWLRNADPEVAAELRGMDKQQIEDAFYRDLEFGTGGLRGKLGAGTNRMNVHIAARATQGLANYLYGRFASPSVVIGYDSRINSDLFARTAAGVLAANGIRVRIWPELLPVPTVSFAVRCLGASAGIMITASHNPAVYNGYKVYGSDGCQITTEAAAAILAEIEALDVFSDVRRGSFEGGLADGRIGWIGEDVFEAYLASVRARSVLGDAPADRSAAIVYTPLCGTGRVPVLRVLRESGFENVTVVAEQEQPDGSFPTCPYPNPEIREAMELGLRYAERLGADLLLATDPDCDRVGIAVREQDGSFRLLTGNETGLLLLDYVCARRTASGTMPEEPVMIKTIVTTDLAEQIAAKYGVQTVNVLTGFKFIGEQIGLLEQQGQENRYVFGFEESYGYLTGPCVRDKDGVDGACSICEMFAYYAAQGVSLPERLEAIYREHGYCLNTLRSFQFEGSAGFETMQRIMASLRTGIERIGSKRVLKTLDYAQGLDGLPKSDTLKYLLEDGCSVVIRPSGTEPKLKAYFSVRAADRSAAEELTGELLADVSARFC